MPQTESVIDLRDADKVDGTEVCVCSLEAEGPGLAQDPVVLADDPRY